MVVIHKSSCCCKGRSQTGEIRLQVDDVSDEAAQVSHVVTTLDDRTTSFLSFGPFDRFYNCERL